MLEQIETILRERCRLTRAEPLLAGVSGGPDSLCLLHVLHSLGYPVVVAHMDHQLRGESAREAEKARQMTASLGMKFVLHSLDTTAFSRMHGLSLEEGARQARYQFLFREARESGAQAVLVGHTADDQVETVLMHLLRGAGLPGLAGMSIYSLPNAWSQTVPLVRPLLGMWREDIWVYLYEHELSPSLDASNQDVRFYRNRLRHELIPYLETYNPHLKQIVWQTAEILGREDEIVRERLANEWEAVVLEQLPSAITFDAQILEKLPLALQRRIFMKAVKQLRPEARDLDFQAIERAVAVANPRNPLHRCDFTAGLQLRRSSGRIWLTDSEVRISEHGWPEVPGGAVVALEMPGEARLGGNWRLRAKLLDQMDGRSENWKTSDPFQAWLDYDSLDQPLVVRARQPGERFQPLGMASGSIKVSDFMINVKLPEPARKTWPLVVCGERIAWLPGYRPAHPHRITSQTVRVVHLKLLQAENP